MCRLNIVGRIIGAAPTRRGVRAQRIAGGEEVQYWRVHAAPLCCVWLWRRQAVVVGAEQAGEGGAEGAAEGEEAEEEVEEVAGIPQVTMIEFLRLA